MKLARLAIASASVVLFATAIHAQSPCQGSTTDGDPAACAPCATAPIVDPGYGCTEVSDDTCLGGHRDSFTGCAAIAGNYFCFTDAGPAPCSKSECADAAEVACERGH